MTEEDFQRIENMIARHVGVREEGVLQKLDLLAEGQQMLVERMDRMETDLRGDINKLDTRLMRVEVKVNALESRFDKLEGKVDKLEGRFDKLEGRFDKLEGRFDKLEDKVDGIAVDLKAHRHDTEAHRRGYRVRES
jgi:predicted nuclease with TOPRIM domain